MWPPEQQRAKVELWKKDLDRQLRRMREGPARSRAIAASKIIKLWDCIASTDPEAATWTMRTRIFYAFAVYPPNVLRRPR